MFMEEPNVTDICNIAPNQKYAFYTKRVLFHASPILPEYNGAPSVRLSETYSV